MKWLDRLFCVLVVLTMLYASVPELWIPHPWVLVTLLVLAFIVGLAAWPEVL